ncbi:MAG: hypothetical protein PG981_000199 [Wolbachia endosymbiont of Ctenocephalides orientis wCori]|nr:MAG: hypothetical protein PG981_000199 [Wolbachia endosymbiont of Ctenocephalides orientis wCori]
MLKDSAIRATGKAQYAVDLKSLKECNINIIRPTLSEKSKDENFKNAVIDFLTSSIMELFGKKKTNTSIKNQIEKRVAKAFLEYYDKYYNNDHRRSIACLRHGSRSVFEGIMSIITSPTLQTSEPSRDDEPITNEYSDIEKILSYTMRDILKDQKKLKELVIIPEDFKTSSVLEEDNGKLKFTTSAKETLFKVFVRHTLYQTISSSLPNEYKNMWQKNFEEKNVRATAPSAPPRAETSKVGVSPHSQQAQVR